MTAASTARPRRASCAWGWRTAGRRARVRLGFEDQHLPVRALAALRETLPDAGRARAGRRAGRGGARGQGAGGDRARSAPPPRSPTRSTSGSPSAAWSGGRSASWRIALEHEMRLRGAEPAFASIVASGEHGAQPHAVPRDVPVARRRAGHAGHRRARRRLLLGLHPHLGDRRAARRARGDPRDRARRGGGGGRGRPPGPDRARGGRGRARRRSRPRATASTSATGSATASASRSTRRRGWRRPTRRRWPRATSSPSSRASTSPASAGRGSRTSCWSPRTVTRCSAPRRGAWGPGLIGAGALKPGWLPADIERDGTSSPHPPIPAPGRHDGRRSAPSSPPPRRERWLLTPAPRSARRRRSSSP